MEPQTKVIGGFVIKKPTSVRRLDTVREVMIKSGVEAALKEFEDQIHSAWAVEGFWSNVHLEPVYDK